MEKTDQAVAEAARKGDEQAFRVLVERHSQSLFRLAYRMCGNEGDAEDLVQETFLRAFRQLHRFDGRAAFGTWLYRICANCALDLIRAKKSRKELTVTNPDDETTRWLDQVAAPEPSPERLTESGRLRDALGPAMDQLSEMERTAFVLRHYEGCNIEEVAETLGVQANAAKHTIFRAVQKLRRALQPAWGAAR